mgnify:CR=1 FL=1
MRLLSKDEIAAGIRNAMERGSSVEDAIQSFINAGYNPNEVEEAASAINPSSILVLSNDSQNYPKSNKENKRIIQQSVDQNKTDNAEAQAMQSNALDKKPEFQRQQPAQEHKKSKGLIIALIIILLLLVGAIILSVIFIEQVISLFGKLFNR